MSAPTRSLSTLLTRRLALIALGLALVNLTAVALRYASLPDELARSALQRQLDRAAEDVQHSPGPSQLSAKLRADFQTHPQDYAFAVVDARGEQIEAVNPELLPADLQWLHRSETVNATVELDGRSLRISARAIEHADGPLRVIVVMGSPGKIVRELSARDLEWIRSAAVNYRERAQRYREAFKPLIPSI